MKNVVSALMVIVCLIATGSLFGQNPASAREQSGAAESVSQRIPRLIRFGGALHDLAGKPIAGTVDVTFSLYSNEADGAPLWYETQTIQPDSLGRYTALLGAMTPSGVPMELFTEGQAHWLGVMVRGLPEQPRVLLVSVPYAMKAGDAETLGGRPASEYQLAPEANASSTSTSTSKQGTTTTHGGKQATKPGSPTPQVLTATQNYIPVMKDNAGSLGNSVIYQSGTRIGVGTTSPSFGFDLNSNVFAIGPKAALPGAGGTMRFRDDTATVRWAFGIPGSAGATDFYLANPVNGRQPFYIQGGAGSFMLYLNSSSNLGISTNAPAFPLDLNGNILAVGTKTAKSTFGGNVRFRDDTGTVRWTMGLPGTAAATNFALSNVVAATTPLLIEATAPTNTLYLNSTGNVGVGTAAPGQKLSVAGVVESTSGGFKFPDGTTQTTASTGGVATSLNCTGCVGSTQLGVNYAASGAKGGDATNALLLNGLASSAFQPAGSYATLTANTFTGNQSIAGTVGINTTSPVSTLHVLTSGTTPLANGVLAGDGIGGECSAVNCEGVDAISQGSGGIGIYAQVTDTANGWAGFFSGDTDVEGNAYVGFYNQSGGGNVDIFGGDVITATAGKGLLVKSPDGTKCARIGIDNSANIVKTVVTCPFASVSNRTLRARSAAQTRQPASLK